MKLDNYWTIIFCSDCHKPTKPEHLEQFGPRYLCRDCTTDLLTNLERFDLPPQ